MYIGESEKNIRDVFQKAKYAFFNAALPNPALFFLMSSILSHPSEMEGVQIRAVSWQESFPN